MLELNLTMTSNSCSNAEIDEHRWISETRQMLEELEDEDEDTIVSIFSVPMTLRAINQDSYTPQLVAIGPYHWNQPHLLEMERYKLLSAKRAHKRLLESVDFQTLVDQLKLLDSKTRASYHKSLGFRSEMLSWMMAIDAAFLLDFLHAYSFKQGVRVLSKSPDNNAVLRDIGMLENQIPMLVLRKMLELEFQTLDLVDGFLQRMLVGFCKDISPFEIEECDMPQTEASECAHLLDFLYRVVVPRLEEVVIEFEDDRGKSKYENETSVKVGWVRWGTDAGGGLAWFMRRLLLSRPMKILLALPLIVFCHLPPALVILKDPVENLDTEAPSRLSLVEEIMIPSVVELSNSGIVFLPTKGGINAIDFDINTKEFHLPTIRLDVNSEVILRNLVAYEASRSSGPLVLARYTELMNGIIDCKEDARLLREKGIILNHLKSDEEVSSLWNGMSKSLRLTKVSFLDLAIEDVNVYYNRSWRVKFGKFMKVHVLSSWQVLTFLAAVLFLFLMILQVFSSVFASTRRSGSSAS